MRTMDMNTPISYPSRGRTFVVSFQILENYGAHAWDGSGECPQYWKGKGTAEYYVHAPNRREAIRLAKEASEAKHPPDNQYWREYDPTVMTYREWVASHADCSPDAMAHYLGMLKEVLVQVA